MKQITFKLVALSLLGAIAIPASLFAQKEEKDVKEKKEAQQIIITRKGNNEKKITVEINGDNVMVNGKPLSDLKDMDIDINVRLNKLKDVDALTFTTPDVRNGNRNRNQQIIRMYKNDDNKAMLGVTTEKTDDGVRVQNVNKESAAEKMGLQENDIITKIDDRKIENPADLSEAIQAHKPGDKVTVTYLRNKKEQKATGELTAWKGLTTFNGDGPFGDMREIEIEEMMPRIEGMPGMRAPLGGQNWNWNWNEGPPKLGISVQDTDEGKGVKVIDVEEDSNASKAGIKTDDIITQVDDKAVNRVDEIAKMLREKKDKPSAKFQITRNGKSQTIEVKMPRKIRTAEL